MTIADYQCKANLNVNIIKSFLIFSIHCKYKMGDIIYNVI